MIRVRRSDERGRFDHGWLVTAHTFSFGAYRDAAHMAFRGLRVLNEDRVAPGMGFGEHPHRDMEIVSYVLSGTLRHRDSSGGGGDLRPGDVQRMSAGRGVRHSEFNPSATEVVHFLQLWIQPDRQGIQPSYEQRSFLDDRADDAALRLVVSPDGEGGSLRIHADARIHAARFSGATGGASRLAIAPGRGAWVQAARGSLRVNGVTLQTGDGAMVEDETTIELAADAPAEALVIDLA
ncbi:MAG: pirin family protein [Phycisphaerae bacterium]|nr:pirin family protein [Phycisphaerae bacterium]